MSRRLSMIAGILLLLVGGASAETPSPEAMMTARKLVVTLKIADQYRALLPQLLLKLRPVVAQDRPEIERDYDAMTAPGAEIYAPFFTAMIDQIAAVYAASFTLDELRQIEAFYASRPDRSFWRSPMRWRRRVRRSARTPARRRPTN